MNELLRDHPDLVEAYLGALEMAARELLTSQPSWSEEATIVLLHQPQGEVTIAPLRSLAGLLEPISIPGIDIYAWLRLQGKTMDPLQASLRAGATESHVSLFSAINRSWLGGVQPPETEDC